MVSRLGTRREVYLLVNEQRRNNAENHFAKSIYWNQNGLTQAILKIQIVFVIVQIDKEVKIVVDNQL